MSEERPSELHEGAHGALAHPVLWVAQRQQHYSSLPPPIAALGRTTVRMVPSAYPPRTSFGSVPLDPRLVLLADPDSRRAAAFRSLRDNMIAQGMPRVVAVTSAEAHDGKTTCAINLALALAEQPSRSVLLIDGNLFAPSLSGVFGIDDTTPAEPSYHEPWAAPFKLSELTPRLRVATIVRHPGQPSLAFDRQRLGQLVGRLANVGYDHLVIDAPAVEGAYWMSHLLGEAQGVLMVVRAGRTTARTIHRALELLPREKLIGSALMDART